MNLRKASLSRKILLRGNPKLKSDSWNQTLEETFWSFGCVLHLGPWKGWIRQTNLNKNKWEKKEKEKNCRTSRRCLSTYRSHCATRATNSTFIGFTTFPSRSQHDGHDKDKGKDKDEKNDKNVPWWRCMMLWWSNKDGWKSRTFFFAVEHVS